jgi:hypothetical protein
LLRAKVKVVSGAKHNPKGLLRYAPLGEPLGETSHSELSEVAQNEVKQLPKTQDKSKGYLGRLKGGNLIRGTSQRQIRGVELS